MYTKEQIEVLDDSNPLELVTIAIACHQQNRTYCQQLGDDSQPLWIDAPEWQTSSAVMGVQAALINPNPAASHESWMKQKVDDGWVYGEKKDPKAKTHHCIVPYDELPAEQKKKDTLFIEMVQQLGLAMGLIRLRG